MSAFALHLENRREARFPVRIPATLIRGRRAPLALETVDVSVHGLFLRAAEPPPVRQLVKLELRLPPDGRPIVLHGMVVFVRAEAGPRASAGFGVSLVGLDGAVLEAWSEFVRTVAPRASGALRARPSLEDEAVELGDDDIEVDVELP